MKNKEISKYKDLIESSRYGDRISFLLDNPHLAEKELGKSGEYSCCHGTVTYILNANEIMKQLWQEAGHELDNHSDASGNFIQIPNNERPGYVGGDPMELFLNNFYHSSKHLDTVVGFFWKNPKAEYYGFGLGHTGIYLGNLNSEDIMFNQKELAEPFEITSINTFKNNLSEHAKPFLEIRYYIPDIALTTFNLRREFGLSLTI